MSAIDIAPNAAIAVVAYAKDRIERLRSELELPMLTKSQTYSIRGQIAEMRELIRVLEGRDSNGDSEEIGTITTMFEV